MDEQIEQETLINFYHEVSSLSRLLSSTSDTMLRCLADNTDSVDKQTLRHHTGVVNEISEILNTHLAIVTIESNPDFYKIQQPIDINIHGRFMRVAKIFRQRNKNRRINVQFNSEKNIPRIPTLTIAKIIPYLILDNAFKYNVAGREISIDFSMLKQNILIEVSSFGPSVPKELINSLYDKYQRGPNAIQYNEDGRGIGLYFLKKICDLCNFELEIISKPPLFKYDGVDFSLFIVKVLT